MKFGADVPGLRLFQGLGGQPAWAEDFTTEQITRIVGVADGSMAGQSGRQEAIASVEDCVERLHWFAEEIMPEARKFTAPFDSPTPPAAGRPRRLAGPR